MVYIFLADGFEEIEALAPLDILRRAGVSVLTVGVTGKTIRGAHSIEVEADILPDDVITGDIEAVMLPGGLGGTKNLNSNEQVKKIVKYAFDEGKYVCAICAAPMILGQMGLLDGKKATCYPGFEKYFNGGEYVKEAVVRSGNIITSNGMGSAYKFAFEITSVLKDSETAEKIKKEIQY